MSVDTYKLRITKKLSGGMKYKWELLHDVPNMARTASLVETSYTDTKLGARWEARRVRKKHQRRKSLSPPVEEWEYEFKEYS